MKTIENIQLSNSEINTLAMDYKATADESIFNKLMASVKNLAEHTAFKMYNKSRGLHIPEDEFVQEAYLAVYWAVDSYDASKGGNFTTHVKRFVEWKIQDNIIKKSQNKSAQFAKETLSLDVTVNDGQDSFLSAVEYQLASDKDEVFNTAVESVDENDSPDVLSTAKELILAFGASSSSDDYTIIDTTFSVILNHSTESGDIKRKVTKALIEVLGVTSATARKKKSRAFDRFEKFASEKGFSIDMSQF
ncbi:hypothetical protein V7128_07385 [Neobacillus vireti]|uniref:hypothetical protein n=1 Tax=Neobacillus vireti TaxID=220686 RepID=UPI002FFF10AE